MRKLKLSDSQKLVVFLGGMNIVGQKLSKIETIQEKSKEETKAIKELDRDKAIKIERELRQIEKRAIKELRSQIVECSIKAEK